MAELLSYSDSFHFAEYVLRKLFYSNAGAGRFACEVFLIHSVECSEICHISKEACSLDNIVKCKSGFFKNCSYVLAGLLCLLCDGCARYLASCRDYRNLGVNIYIGKDTDGKEKETQTSPKE